MWWAAVLDMLINGEESVGGKKTASKRKPLGKGLSSYQLFRAALDFFCKFSLPSLRRTYAETGNSEARF